jgi:hypothetical protein
MTRFSNDKIERHYFEAFQQAYQLPDGSVAYGDKPDVIIQGTRKIGIEMTNFFLESGSLPDSEQRQRPLRGLIIDEAHKLYRAGGGKNIELTFSFDKGNPITPNRRKQLPKQLADLAHSMDRRESGEIEWHLFRDMMPEISTVWLNAREYRDAKWRQLGTYSPGLMCKDDLEAIVREKEAKSAEYEQCDAHWLLIVVDAMDAAQEQEIRINDPHVDSTVFEKIIVYNTFGQIIDATI